MASVGFYSGYVILEGIFLYTHTIIRRIVYVMGLSLNFFTVWRDKGSSSELVVSLDVKLFMQE